MHFQCCLYACKPGNIEDVMIEIEAEDEGKNVLGIISI